MVKDTGDAWRAGSTYEDYMGRWSRKLAPAFLDWLQAPPMAAWLDLGCGTGALTSAICKIANPTSVLGCDPSSAFVEFARSHVADKRASFVTCEAGMLPERAGGFDSITSSLVLNFLPDPVAALGEMKQRAAPGALISATVWDYAERMEFLRSFWDAACELEPLASQSDEGRRFPICEPVALRSLFHDAGLASIRCDAIDIPTEFSSFEDFWRPFLGGTGPAPGFVAALPARTREKLAANLLNRLPILPDGSISLTARAWAICGRLR